jgi:hypothetical protein
MRIRRVELQEKLTELKEAELATSEDFKGECDLFLGALGFEPRCLTVPEKLASGGFRAKRSIYFEYQSNPAENESNRAALGRALSLISESVESMDCDNPDFTQRFRALLSNVVASTLGIPRLVVDISVFGNRLAFKAYAVLLASELHVRIIYSEANSYHPTEMEYASDPVKWGAEQEFGLERGVGDIHISTEHPGRFADTLPDFALVFPTFGPDRSRATLEWIDSSLIESASARVSWFIGVPHADADRWRVGAMKAHHQIADDTPHLEVSTFDYKASIIAVHEECERRMDRFNINLVPLGSKLQALGSALACIMHPEVRVVFAIPNEYNAHSYSEGTKAIWKIDFATTDVRRALLDVGTMQIDEAI